MDKELIKTDTVWYKIKKFFKGIFSKEYKNENIHTEKDYIKESNIDNSFIESISLDKSVESAIKKRNLANNLMNKKVSIENLSEYQVAEMITFFEKYIDSMDKQLTEIKEDIIKIKQDTV